jgi:hypothetical protein
MNASLNFVEQYIRNLVGFEQILEFIDRWHSTNYNQSLCDYLGLSEQEHLLFVENDDYLKPVLEKKRKAHLRSTFKLIIS